MSKKVTVRDIAEKVGVSTYTVSSALNNKGDISPATTEKVIEAAKALGYAPANQTLLNALQKTMVILTMPDVYNATDEFYARAIQAASKTASQIHCDMTMLTESGLATFLEDADSPPRNHLVVMFCPQGRFTHRAQYLADNGVPVALIRRNVKYPGVLCIRDNDNEGMRALLEHLDGQGHKRIAYVGRRFGNMIEKPRIQLYRNYIKDHTHLEGEFFIKQETDCDNWDELIANAIRDDEITAFMCVQDDLALDTAKAAMRQGWRIPHDIAVTGYNNDAISAHFFPEITSVHIPVEDMISLAIKHLKYMPREATHACATFELDPMLMPRTSTSKRFD